MEQTTKEFDKSAGFSEKNTLPHLGAANVIYAEDYCDTDSTPTYTKVFLGLGTELLVY